MNILHVIPAIAPRYGGPSTVIFSLVSALNELPGVRAEIATTDADGAGKRVAANELPAKSSVHLFRRTCSERWKISLGLRQWLDEHIAEYDVVHIHAIWSFATATAARAAQRHVIPYILRPAGMLSEYSRRLNGWQKRLYWHAVEQKTVFGAAGLHVTSEEEAAEVQAIRRDAQVSVIPNGVDDAAFSEPRDTEALRRRCGPGAADRPIVLFLSRLHPKKGIVDRLLPAIARMRSNCFVAIAGGDDPHAPGHSNEIAATIERCGLRDRVALLGAISSDVRWSLYDGADVFVLPSHSENFGVVVAEAMARGCPVVVADAVQACTHVTAAGAGEVVPGDVSAIAGALDRVLSDAQMRERNGEAGRVYAEQHFRWNQIAQRVRQMYVECLEEDRGSRIEERGRSHEKCR